MIYKWKDGARQALDAQRVGERLERLAAKRGSLTADIVVQDARRATSPLHAAFEWDDTYAAEEYRKDQARDLLRHIVVAPEGEGTSYRAFVVVSLADNGDAYVSTDVALSDDDMRAQVLERALRDLDAWKRKYADLTELASVFAAAAQVSLMVQGGSE